MGLSLGDIGRSALGGLQELLPKKYRNIIRGLAMAAIGAATGQWWLVAAGANQVHYATASKPKRGRGGAGIKITASGAEVPLELIFGTVQTAGTMVYHGSTGTNNKYYDRCIVLCASNAPGIESVNKVWFDDRELDLSTGIDGSGNVTSGDLSGAAQLRIALGTDDQTADSTADTAYSDIDSDCRHRGCPRVWERYEALTDEDDFIKAYPQGIPATRYELSGTKCYDPRLDSTNGGTGSHRYSDPDTWEWSNNPILCAATYAIIGKTDCGMGKAPATDIHWPTVIDQADICDESVTIPDGLGGSTTQSRYQVNVRLSSVDDYRTNLSKLLQPAHGWFVERAGVLYFYCGDAGTSEGTITADELVGGYVYTHQVPIDSRYTSCKASYEEPALQYAVEFARAYAPASALSDDQNRARELEYELAGCTNQYQAQRHQIIELRRQREGRVLRCTLNHEGWAYEAGSVVTLDIDTEQDGVSYTIDGDYRIIDYRIVPVGAEVTLLREISYDTVLGDYTEVTAYTAGVAIRQEAPTPSGVTATSDEHGILINWDPEPPTEAAFTRIYRATSSGGSFSKVATVRADVGAWKDTVALGVERFYKLTHIINRDESDFSSEVSASSGLIRRIGSGEKPGDSENIHAANLINRISFTSDAAAVSGDREETSPGVYNYYIQIEAHTTYVGGTSYAMPSGLIQALAADTTYYVYTLFDDHDVGSISYLVSTSAPDILDDIDYLYVGKGRTPNTSGTGGANLGGGGATETP